MWRSFVILVLLNFFLKSHLLVPLLLFFEFLLPGYLHILYFLLLLGHIGLHIVFLNPYFDAQGIQVNLLARLRCLEKQFFELVVF
jgi:hypothetical protein